MYSLGSLHVLHSIGQLTEFLASFELSLQIRQRFKQLNIVATLINDIATQTLINSFILRDVHESLCCLVHVTFAQAEQVFKLTVHLLLVYNAIEQLRILTATSAFRARAFRWPPGAFEFQSFDLLLQFLVSLI